VVDRDVQTYQLVTIVTIRRTQLEAPATCPKASVLLDVGENPSGPLAG